MMYDRRGRRYRKEGNNADGMEQEGAFQFSTGGIRNLGVDPRRRWKGKVLDDPNPQIPDAYEDPSHVANIKRQVLVQVAPRSGALIRNYGGYVFGVCHGISRSSSCVRVPLRAFGLWSGF